MTTLFTLGILAGMTTSVVLGIIQIIKYRRVIRRLEAAFGDEA